MKAIYLFVFFIFVTPSLLGQDIPEHFRLTKVIQAKDLVVGHINAILVTGDLKHMLISYDHKPTLLRVYETKQWEQVNEVAVPGSLYLGQSKVDCEHPELLYGDYGNVHPKFYTINILSGYRTKIKTKELPTKTCGYSINGKPHLREQQFRVKDTFIFEINYPRRTIKVFTKKVKRT